MEDASNSIEQSQDLDANKASYSESRANSHAFGGSGGNGGAGGSGGHAINITYVDNYAIVNLMYTFMLAFMEEKGESNQSNEFLQTLVTTLSALKQEQVEFRKEFITVFQQIQRDIQ